MNDWTRNLVVGVILAAILVGALVLLGWANRCAEGEYRTVHIEAYDYQTPIYMWQYTGNIKHAYIIGWRTQHVPAHDKQVFVCLDPE